MDYNKHYNNLIDKAKTCTNKGYVERHHIIPRCLGGLDIDSNIVELTPEEHYVAHQLLIKIHPDNHKLVYAARMMVPNRSNNKMYGWIRRRYSKICKQRLGMKNSSYGTMWICNIASKQNLKIKRTDPIPIGWIKGRSVWNSMQRLLSKEERSRNRSKKISETLKKKYATGELKVIISEATKEKMSMRKLGNKSLTGGKWITNGIENKVIFGEEIVPEGWRKGKIYRNRGERVSRVSSKHEA